MAKILKTFSVITTLGLLVCVATMARASVFLGSIEIPNLDNLFEDVNREAYVDVNSSGTFDVDDVLVGYAVLGFHSAPAGSFGALGNRVEGIFSQQVASITPAPTAGGGPYLVTFKPTTVAGLTLAALVPGIPAGPAATNGILAVFDSPTPAVPNLITTSPGNLVGSPTVNIFDYFASIEANLSLSLVAGIGNPGGLVGLAGPTSLLSDYLSAHTTSPGSALINTAGAIGGLPLVPTSVDIGSFSAGLTILLNNDSAVSYNKVVAATETVFLPDGSGGFVRHDLAITRGTIAGESGAVNNTQWDNINPPPDSGLDNPGGFTTNASYVVNPSFTGVPEPCSLCIWLVGLLGGGIFLYRRNR